MVLDMVERLKIFVNSQIMGAVSEGVIGVSEVIASNKW